MMFGYCSCNLHLGACSNDAKDFTTILFRHGKLRSRKWFDSALFVRFLRKGVIAPFAFSRQTSATSHNHSKFLGLCSIMAFDCVVMLVFD